MAHPFPNGGKPPTDRARSRPMHHSKLNQKVMVMLREMLLVVALAFAALLVGCDPSTGPKATVEAVVPVSGTLTYMGSPLENYQISFLPSDGRRPAIGTTDATGRFTMGTNLAGDGAPPGTHKVTVVWSPPTPPDGAGQETVIDDPALLPKPNVQIPAKYSSPETSGLTQEVPVGGLKDLRIDLQ
jgi:hypothetical protein